MLKQPAWRHCATVALDACIFRDSTYVEQHNTNANNGVLCEHTHQAWIFCHGCHIESSRYAPKHRQEPAKDGKVSV